ncbi:DUF2238 domain-containing protein [Pseudomonas sp. CDFA 602]|uniref:DUF2238 domain-containing protein n=1 Tax=Pseudomonas californiensis TaxID=2829823 RepID=UPI001E2985A7|nr:DUF2238 domain-containing protein [Pseudomonas californiensis]MCD5996747.1 DUF2238 domain-containing protein [Pseudomonas californiensis]MCD6002345.1 DUF2238 domain-containing protein [Pseudomonas californiensis]
MLTDNRASITPWLHCAFLGVFLWLGWDPADRKTWLIENSLIAVGVLAVWFTRRRFYWTPWSWAMVVLFLCLHQVGTHYTYPDVPYVAAIEHVTGLNVDRVFDLQRNHYDRFVHLAYGLLMAIPLREVITRKCHLEGAWASLIAWSFVLSTSMLYELMEWIGGQYVGGGNSSFVGAQGDFWDAQQDMAAAAGGALLVLVCRGHSLRERIRALSARN